MLFLVSHFNQHTDNVPFTLYDSTGCGAPLFTEDIFMPPRVLNRSHSTQRLLKFEMKGRKPTCWYGVQDYRGAVHAAFLVLALRLRSLKQCHHDHVREALLYCPDLQQQYFV